MYLLLKNEINHILELISKFHILKVFILPQKSQALILSLTLFMLIE
jgi:hypothetical protein